MKNKSAFYMSTFIHIPWEFDTDKNSKNINIKVQSSNLPPKTTLYLAPIHKSHHM